MGAQVVLPVCLYIPRSAKAAACGVSIEKAAVTHICFRLMGAACLSYPVVGIRAADGSCILKQSHWELNTGYFLLEASNSTMDRPQVLALQAWGAQCEQGLSV